MKRLLLFLLLITFVVGCSPQQAPVEPSTTKEPVVTTVPETTAPETTVPEVTVPATTVPTTTTATLYYLAAEELDLVERVVMAEAGGEPYAGQMAVAQCILQACLEYNMRPATVVQQFKYTKNRPDPSESVRAAVKAVFVDGDRAVSEDIMYFYAPARVESVWHESKNYVCTIGGHRFFSER